MEKSSDSVIDEKRCCSNPPIFKISYRLPDFDPEILLVCNSCYEIPCYKKSIIHIETLK